MKRRKHKLADSVANERITPEDRQAMADAECFVNPSHVDEAMRKAGEEFEAMIAEDTAFGRPRGRGRPPTIPPLDRRASERAGDECRKAMSRMAALLLRAVTKGLDETRLKREAYRAARDGRDAGAVARRVLWEMLAPEVRRVLDALPDADIARAFGIDVRTLGRWRSRAGGRKRLRRPDPTKSRKPKRPDSLAAPDAAAEE